MQQQKEEMRRRLDQQVECTETQRRSRDIQRMNRTSEGDVSTVFISLFSLTFKTLLYVLAIKNMSANRNPIMHYQHHHSFVQHSMFYSSSSPFTEDLFRDFLKKLIISHKNEL